MKKPLLITGRLRSLMHRKLKKSGEWRGTRSGVKIKLRLLAQLTLDGEAIAWEARFGREWQQGKASDVFAAVLQIEGAAAKAARVN
jgi:hypothetical protein